MNSLKLFILFLVFIALPCLADEDPCSQLLTPTLQAQIDQLELNEFNKQARNAIRSQTYRDHQISVFKKLLSLNKDEISQLSTSQLIKIFSSFAQWNFLPPSEYSELLLKELEIRLPQWRDKDFFHFAFYRKLTPLILPESFLETYKKVVLERFESLSTESMMEVLGAELFHTTVWSTHEANLLVKTVTNKLNATQREFRIKPLKELYRGLLSLRALEPGAFFSAIVPLEQAIEEKLALLNLSLSEDGTSGAQNDEHRISPERQAFEFRLDNYLGRTEKRREYANPILPGFYDPVDVFYPEKRLILEWDGPQHYFRSLWPDGRLNTDIPRVLRPIDQIKDKSLARQSYQVLRISPELTDILPLLEIEELLAKSQID